MAQAIVCGFQFRAGTNHRLTLAAAYKSRDNRRNSLNLTENFVPDPAKLGLQISLGSGPVRERLAVAKEAEELGYSSLWVAEVSGPDALVSLAALALNTS